MVILDPEADDELVGQAIDRINKVLTEHQGEAGSVDTWGRRKLAYEIERKAEGYYFVMTFTAEAAALAELDRVLSFADEVLRFKVVRTAA
jgi:small subunit ribosomal protein S6